jgi:hypothetical protein
MVIEANATYQYIRKGQPLFTIETKKRRLCK